MVTSNDTALLCSLLKKKRGAYLTKKKKIAKKSRQKKKYHTHRFLPKTIQEAEGREASRAPLARYQLAHGGGEEEGGWKKKKKKRRPKQEEEPPPRRINREAGSGSSHTNSNKVSTSRSEHTQKSRCNKTSPFQPPFPAPLDSFFLPLPIPYPIYCSGALFDRAPYFGRLPAWYG